MRFTGLDFKKCLDQTVEKAGLVLNNTGANPHVLPNTFSTASTTAPLCELWSSRKRSIASPEQTPNSNATHIRRILFPEALDAPNTMNRLGFGQSFQHIHSNRLLLLISLYIDKS